MAIPITTKEKEMTWWQAAASMYGTYVTNEQKKREAEKQRNFQAEMRGTQYQAQMADLKEAGLNPILAANLGGAGTPSGAMAQNLQDPISTGLQVGSQTEKTESETDLIEEKKLLTEVEKILKEIGIPSAKSKEILAQAALKLLQHIEHRRNDPNRGNVGEQMLDILTLGLTRLIRKRMNQGSSPLEIKNEIINAAQSQEEKRRAAKHIDRIFQDMQKSKRKLK